MSAGMASRLEGTKVKREHVNMAFPASTVEDLANPSSSFC